MPNTDPTPARRPCVRYSACLLVLTALLGACRSGPWNDPYPAADVHANVLYSSFEERPKHLDPVQSYSSNEYALIAQIYEPPLQYHYLKRPYTLVPLAASEMPQAVYLDEQHRRLPMDVDPTRIAYSVYEIHIQPGIRYQPHPALARDAQDRPLYQALTPADLEHINTLADFAKTGTRELSAADYVYEIKRLAHPRLHTPILGIMSDYIVGLKEYAQTLKHADEQLREKTGRSAYLDLEKYPLEGAQVIDSHTYRITIHGKYPQLLYWLAMPFFAPMPPEADRFYSQSGMEEKNLTLDWYPIGTGPYMLTVNNPNRQMELSRNPNFHGEAYPTEGMPGDAEHGLLRDAGKAMPFVDRVVYSLEQETIPYWNKFLQGFYDVSGISSDSFDQAVSVGAQGEVSLTDTMREKGIQLQTAVSTTVFYLGFNMLDPVVGGNSESARKLRQAVSIALDQEEFISIFQNGRGIAAQGPIPPGIFGYVEGQGGINSYMYDWVDNAPRRKSLEVARRLLAEAGYPNGVDAKSGAPLTLYFDTTAAGPDDKSRLNWMRKQLDKLKLQLVIRDTDYNRFQDKMQKGAAQLFQWGWNADYPDPENFLFLLYGPNSKVGHNGENAANYDNPEFNRLFEQMKAMDNGPARQAIIDRMVEIARHDAPWVWGFHPKQFTLYHAWFFNANPNQMANNSLKYKRIDPQLRAHLRDAWNPPVLWPLGLIGLLLVLGTLPAVITYWHKEHRPIVRAVVAAEADERTANERK